jgi:ribosomal protein S15P/S13E
MPWNWGKVVEKHRSSKPTDYANQQGLGANWARRNAMLKELGYQGGGMVGPSWMPWNWGKVVEKHRSSKPTDYANQQGLGANLARRRAMMKELGYQGGGITENTGMSIPGATADRQAVLTQPGEYILPVDTVTRLGGPNAIDRLVASTDSNSTAAKLGTLSRSSMAVGQPVMSDDSIISTLPPIVQSMGGGPGGGGAGFATKVPSVSVSSNSSRRNAKTMYGLV